MFLYLLSGDHTALGAYEARCCASGDLTEIGGHWCCGPGFAQNDLALSRCVIRVLWHGPAPALLQGIASIELPQQGTFAVTTFGDAQNRRKEIADALRTTMKVDLASPSRTYTCLFMQDQAYFGELVYENTDRFDKRKAHRRPALHPTSLHPKIAKAMVNLAQADKISDPFCGSGGILIEGCLLKKDMTGVDIDPKMIARAKENLEHFGCEAKLIVGDALKHDADIIVTDVPYGKNTKSQDVHELYRRFLATTKAKRIVISASEDLTPYLQNYHVAFSYTYKVHASMQRTIYVLTHKSSMRS